MAKKAVNLDAVNKKKGEGPDPSTPSIAYKKMLPKWAMINALLGGTAVLRSLEKQYLPQHAEESNSNYNERLGRATLFNMFELTLESLVGKVFVDEVKMKDDAPKSIRDLEGNIDLQGTNLTTFCREWFRQSMAKGFAHVMVDMPAIEDAVRDGRTLADDRAENKRPFFKLVHPEDVIFASSTVIGGIETITHMRILETEVERVGFDEVVKYRIRVLEPGRWELWELQPKTKGSNKPEWNRIKEGTSDLNKVPVITFYPTREGFMEAKPPLEDLAYLNIAHWQSTADQRNILTVARFPMLAGSGVQQAQGTGEQMAIGPRQFLASRDPQARFYYVEHSGRAIGAGREDLADLEAAMSSYGAEFLRRKIAGRTATERALDSSEAISPLKDMALRFQNAISQALGLLAEWMGEASGPKDAPGGHVELNTEFTEEAINSATMQALSMGRERGDVSRRRWLMEMKRLEVISPDMDVDEEMNMIEWEAVNLIVKPIAVRAIEQIREDAQMGPGQTGQDMLNQTAETTTKDPLAGVKPNPNIGAGTRPVPKSKAKTKS